MADESQAAREERSRRLGLLYAQWSKDHPDPTAEPDDDPDYVARAREIMGLPPLVTA